MGVKTVPCSASPPAYFTTRRTALCNPPFTNRILPYHPCHGPQPAAKRSRQDAFRTAAGPGGGRHGQDSGGHLPHRRADSPSHRARSHPRGYLHQQGGRGNEGAVRRAPGKETAQTAGNLHLPLALRPHPAAAHHAPRLPGRLRHLRPRRPGEHCPHRPARDQSGRGPAQAGRSALSDRPLEEQLDPARGSGFRRPDRQGTPGRVGLSPLSERLEGGRHRRFRRPAAADRGTFHPLSQDPRGRGRAASIISWSTSTRTPTAASIASSRPWPPDIATCASWATTTSRSMAGGAPKSRTS